MLKNINSSVEVHLSVGDEVFNHGDQCNESHFGTVEAIKQINGYPHVQIRKSSGEPNLYWVPQILFAKEYKGHGGTRLVKAEAYCVYRNNLSWPALESKRLQDCNRR